MFVSRFIEFAAKMGLPVTMASLWQKNTRLTVAGYSDTAEDPG
ncbi:hypothetical protein F385_3881 [Pantoea agglomerans 299R]|nr:hypothetical protein F385_3881 [Pantoea agglomerans 299R]